MAQPYVGEIRMFAGNFAPNGWMFCEGQTLPISENEVLFQLIGTTYGGDGQETFNLPNLASRVPDPHGHRARTARRTRSARWRAPSRRR
jgi:microcystin-dependent protein